MWTWTNSENRRCWLLAHHFTNKTGTPHVDNRALFPDHEGSQIGSKHPRADDQVGRLGAGLTDIVMYDKMVVMIDIVMSL